MKRSLSQPLFLATVLAVLALPAAAIPLSPQSGSFGTLAGATFGGSGIPNNAVAITTIGDVTLGLSAAQRYENPVVTNDGAGTFFAVAGSDAAHGQPNYARWNFNFYIAGLSNSQSVALYYDLNPAVGNDVSTALGPIVSDFQNSWNLGMGFLGGGFNPAAAGEYDFALVLLNAAGGELGRSAIRVNVSSPGVPDSGATLALVGLAAVALAGFQRRFAASRG